jgi:hypothetical protein
VSRNLTDFLCPISIKLIYLKRAPRHIKAVMPIPSTADRKRPQFRVPGANLPLAGKDPPPDRWSYPILEPKPPGSRQTYVPPQTRVPASNPNLDPNSPEFRQPSSTPNSTEEPSEVKYDPIGLLLDLLPPVSNRQPNASSVLIDMDVFLAIVLEVGEPLKALNNLQKRGDQIIWGANSTCQEWLDESGATGLVKSLWVFKDVSLPRSMHGARAEGWGMRFHQQCTIPFRAFMKYECAQFTVAYEQLMEIQ